LRSILPSTATARQSRCSGATTTIALDASLATLPFRCLRAEATAAAAAAFFASNVVGTGCRCQVCRAVRIECVARACKRVRWLLTASVAPHRRRWPPQPPAQQRRHQLRHRRRLQPQRLRFRRRLSRFLKSMKTRPFFSFFFFFFTRSRLPFGWTNTDACESRASARRCARMSKRWRRRCSVARRLAPSAR
jgi:hypothetical protein